MSASLWANGRSSGSTRDLADDPDCQAKKSVKELMRFINSKMVCSIARGAQCQSAYGLKGTLVERISAWADIIGWSVVPLAAYLDCSIICAGIGSAAKALLTLAMAVKFVVLSILLLAYRAPWYMVPLALLAEGIAWFIPGSLIYLLNPYSNLIHYLSNRSNRG